MRTSSMWLAVVGVTLASATSCSDDVVYSTGAGGSTGSAGGTASGGSNAGGSGATVSSAGGAGGNQPSECSVAVDCDTLLGTSPCGVWVCNAGNCEAASAGCVDADQDGYGSGATCACAGLDCDDQDELIADSVIRSCYSGPAGTEGVGACQTGTETCLAGVFSLCVGEVTPTGEACNNQDDDCNGTDDDGLGTFSCGLGVCAATVNACTNGAVGTCVAGMPAASDGPTCNGVDDDCDGPVDEDCQSCILVAPTGNDATGNATLPFLTIQAGINYAFANVGPKTVCVAAGAGCGVTGTYQNAANTTVTMANGVSVLGNYDSSTRNRCGNSTTIIRPATAEGVTFPAAVQSATVLDGFRIERTVPGTVAAVTVNGATAGIISSVTIPEQPNPVTNSYGINVINAGDVTITRSRVDAGNGTAESIAVRSIGSKVRITGNCASVNAQGRCDDFCFGNPSLRGRTIQGSGSTYAAYLENSPGSTVETSALCALEADVGAAVRIAGDGTGIVVRGNTVNAFGGLNDSHGIWMEDCNDAAPWIVDNFYINAAGDNQQTRVDGVRAIGACHPVVDSNLQITGGGEGQASNPTGVHCAANAQNVPSKCAVLGNLSIEGSDFGFPPIATGVRCDSRSCVRVANNVITGRGGMSSYGLWLEGTAAFIDSNVIRGGCSPTAVGIQAVDASSRIQNNRVFGATPNDCTGGVAIPVASTALVVLASAGLNEVDVHSNDFDGFGGMASCTSRAIELGITGAAPSAGVGVFRNNILRAGNCPLRYGVSESVAAADPRIFQNNDLDPFNAPTALYFDEGATGLTMASAVNALVDMTVSGVFSADAGFVAYPTDLHLASGSACISAGVATGAPLLDFEGTTRDLVAPDVGADEL